MGQWQPTNNSFAFAPSVSLLLFYTSGQLQIDTNDVGITNKFSPTIIVAKMMIIVAICVALGTPLMVGLGIGTSLQPLLFFYPTVPCHHHHHLPCQECGRLSPTLPGQRRRRFWYQQVHNTIHHHGTNEGTRVYSSVHAPLRPLLRLLLPGHLSQQLLGPPFALLSSDCLLLQQQMTLDNDPDSDEYIFVFFVHTKSIFIQ